MITLATLKEATAQQVFDQVVTHLRTQGERSTDAAANCVYRYGKLKCAAGALISDDEYKPEMDGGSGLYGTSWESLIKRELVPATGHTGLIGDLQCVHDSWEGHSYWEGKLAAVALTHSLTYTAP